MEEKINSLLQKCIKNRLQFKYNSLHFDSIDIWSTFGDDMKCIGTANIKNYEYATPDEELDKLHDAVDEYLEVRANE